MQELEALREKIDEIDSEIISLMQKRISIAQDIASVKKANNLPIHIPEREKAVIDKIRALASEKGLDPDTIEDIYKLLIEYTRNSEGE